MQTKSSNSPGNLTHPSREEWMEFLYDESAPARRAELESHLKTCPACAREVARWRNTMASLNADELPLHSTRSSSAWPGWKWAAAAAFIIGALGIGFGLGRAGSPSANELRSLRAELQTALSQARLEIQEQQKQAFSAAVAGLGTETQRLLAEYGQAAEERRLQDRQGLLRTVQELDASRQSDILSLRKDLETVALFTDDGLRKTEAQLFQLATYTQPPATNE
jgi:hypothetical protein